ncbi:MAG: AAC(3) family N-acetyltransferase [Clostridia bacterium]|nr:AAC(3) family N-acetyltransferase [Clostridia bacterium]
MTVTPQKTYTRADLLHQLAQLRAPRDRIVLMHSSLRLIGSIEGGAEALLDVLIDYFAANGGLFCIPTHTWANISHPERITLDVTDPHTCLGALSDLAVADSRGIRSQNPTHSMVVFGDRERAEAFIRDETNVPSGTAPNSCYGKLYEQGGYVLLAGVSHNKNTYLHCVDELLGATNRLTEEPRPVTVRTATGEILHRHIRSHYTDYTKDISQRFPKYETAFRYHGAITDGFIGNAPTQLCDARRMYDTVKLIRQRCDTDPLSDERAMPPKWYC